MPKNLKKPAKKQTETSETSALVGTEKLAEVSKDQFQNYVFENLNPELSEKVEQKTIHAIINNTYKNEIERLFDVQNALKGIESQLRSRIAQTEAEAKITEMEELDVLNIAWIDNVTKKVAAGKMVSIFGIEQGEQSAMVIYKTFGCTIGRNNPHELASGEILKVKMDEFKATQTGKSQLTGRRVEKVLQKGVSVSEIMGKADELATPIEEYDLRFYRQFDPEIFDGNIYSIRPIPILEEVKTDVWKRTGWKPFLSTNKYDNTIHVFQASLSSKGLMVNVNFNEQELGAPLLSFGHEDHFNIVSSAINDKRLIDPAVEPVKGGFCFDEKGKFNGNNCVTTCMGCIYSMLTRLSGTPVRAFVSLRKKDEVEKEGEPIVYLNCDGFALLKTGEIKKSTPTRKDKIEKPTPTKEEDITDLESAEEPTTEEPSPEKPSQMTFSKLTPDDIAKIKESYTVHGLTEEDIIKMYSKIKPAIIKTILKKAEKEAIEESTNPPAKKEVDLKTNILQFMQNNSGIFDRDEDSQTVEKVSGKSAKEIKTALKELHEEGKIFESMEGVYSLTD